MKLEECYVGQKVRIMEKTAKRSRSYREWVNFGNDPDAVYTIGKVDANSDHDILVEGDCFQPHDLIPAEFGVSSENEAAYRKWLLS